jgi:hypothetical protein
MNVDENSKSMHRILEGLKELYAGRLEELQLCASRLRCNVADDSDSKS